MVVSAVVLGLVVSETVGMILAKVDGGLVAKQALVTFVLLVVLPVWFYVVMKMTEASIDARNEFDANMQRGTFSASRGRRCFVPSGYAAGVTTTRTNQGAPPPSYDEASAQLEKGNAGKSYQRLYPDHD